MGHPVIVKVTGCGELFVAHRTDVRSFARVDAAVSVERTGSTKSFLAYIADVWPLTC